MIRKKDLNEKWYEIISNSSFGYEVKYKDEINFKACSLANRVDQYIKWYSKNVLSKYNQDSKKIKLLESIKYQLPYTFIVAITLILLIIIWYIIGIPLGMNSFPTI